jgi:hypothetical protein
VTLRESDELITSLTASAIERTSIFAHKDAMICDRCPEYIYPFTPRRDDHLNRWTPRTVINIKHRAELSRGASRSIKISLIDNKDITDLHDTRFNRLYLVAQTRNRDHECAITNTHNIDF